jgi:hypothetical protein
MAVIPTDAGVRMRTQSDPGQLQALAPIRSVPAGLPEFQPGQTFSARIQELLPDNTYKALVAGRQLTLQLPEGASAGDLLELTVVDRTAQTLIAKRTEGQPTAAQIDARPYQYTRISDAGRLIGQLLPAEGEAPPPAALSRGQPVLSLPPASGSQLATALQSAVSQSGLFYEAHQAQWVAGERALASLRIEPQGQLPAVPRPMPAYSAPATPETGAALTYGAGAEGSRIETGSGARPDLAGRLPEMSATRSETQAQAGSSGVAQQGATPTVPDGIRSIVQQQLDAVATQRLAWHGEVWPGQSLDWAIQRDLVEERDSHPGETGEAAHWTTSLRLTMPRLGTVDAVLHLSGDRLRIQLATTDADVATSLQRQRSDLTETLANAGVNVQSLDIRHES